MSSETTEMIKVSILVEAISIHSNVEYHIHVSGLYRQERHEVEINMKVKCWKQRHAILNNAVHHVSIKVHRR